MVPYFNTATGAYTAWTSFMAQLGATTLGIISIIWGAFIAYQKFASK
jgi:hypothetical protein